MPSKKLSFADHAWLRMDRPSNLMIITGLMTFDAPLDFERFKTNVQQILLEYPPFTQRLVKPRLPFLRAAWEDDPDFNLDNHLERVTLPSPGDQASLQDLISSLLSTGLDPERPLWQFYIIDNYGKGSALVARLHHCIADGIALMQILLAMTHTAPEADRPIHPGAALDYVRQSIKQFDHPLEIHLRPDGKSLRRLFSEGAGLLTNPARARRAVRFGASFTAAVGRLALRWPDPQTAIKGPLSIQKRVAWTEPLDLDAVKRIGKAFGGTVNDVLLTIVAGALRRYLQERGSPQAERDIRGIVPVNLRPLETADELGNRFGLVFVSLPIDIEDPVERLRRLKKNMDGLKSSAEALAAYSILNVLGAVPLGIQDIAVALFDTKCTAVMTNVPGPQHPLYLAGAPLNMIMAWVPQSGRIGLGVSILSYNHKVWVGFATDQSLAPDPQNIVAAFAAEYEAIHARAESVLAKRQSSVLSMFAMLDEALHTLDEIQSNASQKKPPAARKPKRKAKTAGS